MKFGQFARGITPGIGEWTWMNHLCPSWDDVSPCRCCWCLGGALVRGRVDLEVHVLIVSGVKNDVLHSWMLCFGQNLYESFFCTFVAGVLVTSLNRKTLFTVLTNSRCFVWVRICEACPVSLWLHSPTDPQEQLKAQTAEVQQVFSRPGLKEVSPRLFPMNSMVTMGFAHCRLLLPRLQKPWVFYLFSRGISEP